MTRQLRVAVLSGLFLVSCLAMVHSVRAQNAPPVLPPQPVSDQMTDIPYFTLRDGMNSTLTLNNVGPTSTPVTVTIYNLEGKAQVLNPITLAPHSFQQIELGDVVVGDDFDAGNLRVTYTGISMGVTCQVSVSNPDKRVSFESRDVWNQQDMQDMMPSMTKNLSGILWLPQETTEGFLAVTNIGTSKETVHVSTGSKSKTISLYPRQTQLVKLSDEFAQRGPGASLVQLQQDGMPGDIVTTGFVLDLKRGYSSAFTMFDPGLTTSSHLAGAHLRIGKPDQSEDFPDGTYFRSPLLLANVGAAPVTAHVSVDYTMREKLQMTPINPKDADATEDKFKKTVAVRTLTIAPGDVQRVELSDALEKLGIDRVTEAGVDVDYDTPPGTLIGQLASVDQSGDYSFEVPIKDPAGMMEMMEGIYPWTLEDGNNTVLHLKNTTNQPAAGLLLFDYYEDGAVKTYDYPLISLEPYQTVAIDVRKLIDSKTPDVLGHIIPADATHGQAQWRQEIPYSMIGRAEQTNVKEGIARSFSCGSPCCRNYYQNQYMSPSTLSGSPGGGGTFTAMESGYSCNGMHFGPYADITNGAWTTTFPSVATVSNVGTVTFQGGGSSLIGVGAYNLAYVNQTNGCTCQVHTSYPVVVGTATVLVPTSLSIVAGTSSATSEATCPVGGGTGCGISRKFTYQVNDQNGHPLQVGGYAVWDAFGTPSPNGLNMSSFTTTCNPANTGPCGVSTNGSGQFQELSLSVCASACFSGNSCTTAGGASSQVTQAWHVGPSVINQTIKYYCDHVTVNGQ